MESALSQPIYLLVFAGMFIVGGTALLVSSIFKRENQTTQQDTTHRYHKIINNAHNEARAIIDTASVASVGILSDSKATSEHLSEDLDKVLHNIAQRHIEEMKRAGDAFNKSYEDKLASLEGQLKTHTEQTMQASEARLNDSLEKYMAPIAASAANSQNVIEQRTQELMTQVEKDLAEYKAAATAKVDAEVQDLVKKTYRDVLKKSISEKQQEELVMESLEKVKKEGGLSI